MNIFYWHNWISRPQKHMHRHQFCDSNFLRTQVMAQNVISRFRWRPFWKWPETGSPSQLFFDGIDFWYRGRSKEQYKFGPRLSWEGGCTVTLSGPWTICIHVKMIRVCDTMGNPQVASCLLSKIVIKRNCDRWLILTLLTSRSHNNKPRSASKFEEPLWASDSAPASGAEHWCSGLAGGCSSVPKVQCSEGHIFRSFYIPKVLCSEGFIFRRLYVPKVIYSEGSMFRKSIANCACAKLGNVSMLV